MCVGGHAAQLPRACTRMLFTSHSLSVIGQSMPVWNAKCDKSGAFSKCRQFAIFGSWLSDSENMFAIFFIAAKWLYERSANHFWKHSENRILKCSDNRFSKRSENRLSERSGSHSSERSRNNLLEMVSQGACLWAPPSRGLVLVYGPGGVCGMGTRPYTSGLGRTLFYS